MSADTFSESSATSSAPDCDAVVIGAGFSGLYMVRRLRDELGLDVRGFEAGAGVGGTWYWNRYPGARTDSPYSAYGFTWSPELAEEWSWSERYPGQQEVLRYLEFVADRFDLRRSFTFGARVTAARYDEGSNVWTVTTDTGESVRATYVITAVGLLSAPNVPPFPGLTSFRGQAVHSSAWPEGGVDVRFLVGLLNSKVLRFAYVTMVRESRQRAFPQVKLGPLGMLPIRSINFAAPSEKARHDRIVDLVESMLQLQRTKWKQRTDERALSLEAGELDARIDAEVFALYDLDAEDITRV